MCSSTHSASVFVIGEGGEEKKQRSRIADLAVDFDH